MMRVTYRIFSVLLSLILLLVFFACESKTEFGETVQTVIEHENEDKGKDIEKIK